MILKLLSYNLFEGCRQTLMKLVEFIDLESPDVICFQEANNWQKYNFRQLKAFANKLGFEFWVYGDSVGSYKLVTLSRRPILDYAVYREGFGHCVIKCVIQGSNRNIEVWNLHLNPRSEDLRLDELRRIRAVLNIHQPVIMLGDFNSLSAFDISSGLNDQLKRRGITKFADGPRHDAIDYLHTMGLVDVVAAVAPEARLPTVPSAYNNDPNRQLPLRLDYAFATLAAIGRVRGARVVRTRLTNAISDHYPLVVEIDS